MHKKNSHKPRYAVAQKWECIQKEKHIKDDYNGRERGKVFWPYFSSAAKALPADVNVRENLTVFSYLMRLNWINEMVK